jgi:ribosomal protein S8
MVKTSVLNDALNAINNVSYNAKELHRARPLTIEQAEKAGKRQVLIRPSSKVIVKFLTVMQRHGTSTPLSIHHTRDPLKTCIPPLATPITSSG